MDPQEKTLKVAFIAFPSCLVAIGLSELFNIIPRDTRETVRSHYDEYLGPYGGETAISPEIEAERSTPYQRSVQQNTYRKEKLVLCPHP